MGDASGVGVAVGKAVGLAITVAVTAGVGCFLAFSLVVPLVAGGGLLELSVSVAEEGEDGGGGVAAAVMMGETVGAKTGVTVTLSGGAFVTIFLLLGAFPAFVTLCVLLT